MNRFILCTLHITLYALLFFKLISSHTIPIDVNVSKFIMLKTVFCLWSVFIETLFNKKK